MATLFLMLASETIMTEVKSVKVFAKMGLFSFLIFVYCMIKRKLLGKFSINLKLEENLLLRGSKDEKIPLRQLLVSTIELLIFCYCLEVMFFKERQ